MAFKYVGNLYGAAPVAPPKDNQSFPMTSNTAAVAGTVYQFTLATGRAVLVAGAAKTAAIVALESASAVADVGGVAQVYIRGQWIRPGDIFEAPITDKDGTALTTLDDAVYVGATVNLNDTGTGIDGETDLVATAGPLSIIEMLDGNKALVVFNACYLMHNA